MISRIQFPAALLLSRSSLMETRRLIVARAAKRPKTWRRLTVYRPPITVVGLRLKTRRRLAKKERGLVRTEGVVGGLKERGERVLMVICVGCGVSVNRSEPRALSGSEVQRLEEDEDDVEEGELPAELFLGS